MTTRLKNNMQTVCIVLILMLFPGTARPQGEKEPAAPQNEASASTPTVESAVAARPAEEETSRT